MPNQQESSIKVFTLPANSDSRGDLTAIDFGDLEINPKRVFWVRNVPIGTMRGGHFHKICNQLLVCMNGQVKVNIALPNGICFSDTLKQNSAVFLPAYHFVEYIFLETNSELIVLADQFFDSKDVFTIEDWKEGLN
jgi:dTDP-4-dehydrorhamnose 3,5-epimerase-like enzyme